jgi:hypothetical protein
VAAARAAVEFLRPDAVAATALFAPPAEIPDFVSEDNHHIENAYLIVD